MVGYKTGSSLINALGGGSSLLGSFFWNLNATKDLEKAFGYFW